MSFFILSNYIILISKLYNWFYILKTMSSSCLRALRPDLNTVSAILQKAIQKKLRENRNFITYF